MYNILFNIDEINVLLTKYFNIKNIELVDTDNTSNNIDKIKIKCDSNKISYDVFVELLTSFRDKIDIEKYNKFINYLDHEIIFKHKH